MATSPLKGIIANLDMDICIVEKDYQGIQNALEYWGYALDGYTPAQVKAATDDLAANDPYFIKLRKDLKKGATV
jgi:hypothetical protein